MNELEQQKLGSILPDTSIPFFSLLKIAEIPIIIADQLGVIRFWNKGAERTFLWKESEAMNQPLTIIMPDRYKAPHSKSFSKLVGSKWDVALLSSNILGKTVQLYGLRKNSEEFLCDINIVSSFDDNRFCFMAIITDLTSNIDKTILAMGRQMEKTLEEVKKADDGVENLITKMGELTSQHLTNN
jgi:PAS domain S-box-containing protein